MGLIDDQVGIERKEENRSLREVFPTVTLPGHASQSFEQFINSASTRSASSTLSLAIHLQISKMSLLASGERR